MGIQTAPFILAARKRHEAPWYRMYKMRWRQSHDWVKRIFPEPWRPVIDNSDAISLLNLYGREVIPIVTPYLKEHHAGVRYIVFQTLLRLHIEDTSNAHKLFPYFSSFLGDPDEYLRTAIVIQLGEAGHAARDAVPALLRAALDKRSGTPWFRTVTAIALGRIGNPTGDVLSSLRVFLQDADGDTGVQAAIALWKIDRQITNTVLV
jgi:hypothetical protein